jgi:hypothetical protein
VRALRNERGSLEPPAQPPAAAAAARTDTFLDERYRPIGKRRAGTCSPIQQPASATSDPTTTCIHTERKLRNHIAQLTAMGYQVTLEPAA